MDITYWAMGPDGPAWPVDASGEKERAVLLRHTFDSPAEADMTISLLAAYGIPCFPYYDGEGMTGKVIRECPGISADHLEEALGKVVSARHADLKDINLKALQTGMDYSE